MKKAMWWLIVLYIQGDPFSIPGTNIGQTTWRYSIKQPTRCTINLKFYCFAAYTPLDMFRAMLCPSSGAPSNCLCSHWLPYVCRVGRVSSCGRFTSKPTTAWSNHTVTSGCKGSWRGLLMMGTTVPETCRAVYMRQRNKILNWLCI
jgi:hypothetical protein